MLGTPRRSASRRASDEPSGSPRPPFKRALLIAFQVSPGAAATDPDFRPGHSPVASRWASAQARICSTSSLGRLPMLRMPRRSWSNRASVVPPGRPR